MELERLRAIQKETLTALHKSVIIPRNSVALSYLGARVCYSNSHPLKILEEKRITSGEYIKFLLNLKDKEHYSVFAHTPVIIKDVDYEQALYTSSLFVKVFLDYDDLSRNKSVDLLLNLRHFAEVMSNDEFHKLLEDNHIHSVEELERTIYGKSKDEFMLIVPDETQTIVFTVDCTTTKWLSVLCHNYTRIFTHQLVRHTWLNFSQRSHRYTKVERIGVPSSISNYVQKETLENLFGLYSVSKYEDARYIIPQGACTTILSSGPRIVWQDFVKKRLSKYAQYEIRHLAEIVSNHVN